MLSTMKRRIAALLQWKQSAALSRRDHTIAWPDEQGTSRERVGAYPRRWPKRAGTLVACAVLIVMTAGCYRMAAGNESISNKENTAQIKIGDWTKMDVRKILGEPISIVVMAGGEEVWNYVYVSGKMFGGLDNARDMKTFSMRFTREGIVKEKGSWRTLR